MYYLYRLLLKTSTEIISTYNILWFTKRLFIHHPSPDFLPFTIYYLHPITYYYYYIFLHQVYIHTCIYIFFLCKIWVMRDNMYKERSEGRQRHLDIFKCNIFKDSYSQSACWDNWIENLPFSDNFSTIAPAKRLAAVNYTRKFAILFKYV